MRRAVAAADRRFVVREAAAAWRKAGSIDDATLAAVRAAYPDDRARLGIGLRLLAGVAALAGGAALISIVLVAVGYDSAVVFLALAAIFAAATELQTGRLRRAQSGAEYATALLAAVCACVYCGWVLEFDEPSPALAAFSLVWAFAAWRWGYALFASVAAAFVLGALADMELGRLAWILAGIGAVFALLGPARSVRPAPSHRRALAWGSVVFAAAAYAACNVYVLDTLGLHPFRGFQAPPAWARLLAILATALVPVAVGALGVRRHDRSLLALGAVMAAASAATFHHYVAVGPLWLRLALGGVSCGGLALVLRRWLDAGANRERGGFTADALYAERRGFALAQAAATIATLSPGARPDAPREFEGGGGLSGGGGATGGF